MRFRDHIFSLPALMTTGLFRFGCVRAFTARCPADPEYRVDGMVFLGPQLGSLITGSHLLPNLEDFKIIATSERRSA